MFYRNKSEFLCIFITTLYKGGDKEAVKTVKGRIVAKEGEQTVPSAGKVMGSLFWNDRGLIFIDYLQKGKTINVEY